jgi:hypothetical protein
MKKFLILFLVFLSSFLRAEFKENNLIKIQQSSFSSIDKSEESAFWQTVKSAIAHFAGQDDSQKTIDFTQLKGGMSSTKLYTFTVNQKKYVLRTLNIKKSIESRENEIIAHQIAARMGIAPG